MRLSQQISLLVTMLMLIVLLITIYISIHGSRQYLVNQIQVQAQDAGSSLATTLTPILVADEVALAGAMVDSGFERGHYQRIEVKDNEGKLLIERQLPVIVQGVPDWFVVLTEVQNLLVQSPVVHGVTKIAFVGVSIHPGNAYRALWQITLSNIKWVSVLTVVGVLFIWLIISYSLRPLSSVKRQAEEISRQNYIVQKKFPYAFELKQLVVAMNDMAGKLDSLMSAQVDQVIDLTNRVNIDPSTGLLSRSAFDDFLKKALSQDGSLPGQILLIRIIGLERINQSFSFKRGNQELHKVLTRIKELSTSEWKIARLAGADMVVYIPSEEGNSILQRCEQIVQELNIASEDLHCRIGGINIAAGHDKETLLKQANQALQKAMSEESGWYVEKKI